MAAALFCCCFVISNYYCCDIPATLELPLEEKLPKSPTEFGLLYTFYGLPNIILPLVGGILLDKIGSRKSLLLFTVCVNVGQAIIAAGRYANSFGVMLVGRMIFEAGSKSMYVGKSSMITEWFINFELPFAISLIACFPLCGSLLNGAILPVLYKHYDMNFGLPNLVGLFTCIASFIIVIAIVYINIMAEKKDKVLLKRYKKEQRKFKR